MFNLKAQNQQVILSSQLYTTKESAQSGIGSVQKNGSDRNSFELKTSSSAQAYFVLKATNGEVIGTSEMYHSEASANAGIDSVIANSPSTEVTTLDN